MVKVALNVRILNCTKPLANFFITYLPSFGMMITELQVGFDYYKEVSIFKYAVNKTTDFFLSYSGTLVTQLVNECCKHC